MPVPLFTHPDCLRHDPGPDHPETPARLRVLLERARADQAVEVRIAPAGSIDDLLAVHPRAYLDSLADDERPRRRRDLPRHRAQQRELGRGTRGDGRRLRRPSTHALDGRVTLSPRCGRRGITRWRPARWASAWCRTPWWPPAHAQRAGHARVLIIDWDVHHGNGTQALVEHDAAVRYVSLHQHPWYPGTGMADERGVGNVFNVPRGPGAPPAALRGRPLGRDRGRDRPAGPRTSCSCAPASTRCSAIRSAGSRSSPSTTPISRGVCASGLPDAPIVGLLEGGYVPARLADGVLAHVRALA